MTLVDRIKLNPRVCKGRPVVGGTRVPVSVILEQIAEGESWEALLAGYPELTRGGIRRALHCARMSLDHTEMKTVGRLNRSNFTSTGCSDYQGETDGANLRPYYGES